MMENEDFSLSDFGQSISDWQIDAVRKFTDTGNPTRQRAKRPAKDLYVGRVPLPWLRQAIRAGKTGAKSIKTTETALALWFRSGCAKSKTVRLSKRDRQWFCLNRHSYYRALDALEREGLVRTCRQRGRRTEVTLVLTPPKDSGAA